MRHDFRTTAFACAASCMLFLLSTAPLIAQEEQEEERPPPITLEARGGYSLPVATLHDLGARSDFGYGLALTLGISPAFGLYAGWGRDIFHCDRCSGDGQIEASGVEVGGKFIVPDRERAHPWVKAGLLASRSLLETGTSRFHSDRHVGFHGAVGLDAPLGDLISFSPSVRFNSFRSEYDGLEGDFAGFEPRTDFRYFSFDVAVLIHLR